MEKFAHALNLVPGMSYQIMAKFWKRFRNWQTVWQADIQAFFEAGLSREMVSSLVNARKRIDVEKEFRQLVQKNVVAIGRDHGEFLPLLKEIPDPPFLLYRRGAPLEDGQKYVAMVGTRRASTYGAQIAFQLSEAISLQGGIVVSGLAFGIDARAHAAAVQNKKSTVAILASGVTNVTPASHINLAENILRHNGTILSEYIYGEPSYKGRYLARNRLISGLCQATIVIEAHEKSGALITAHHALEQNRQIFALPGDITRAQARGCLRLIASGAQPIVAIEETLVDLGFASLPRQLQLFDAQEELVFAAIQKNPASTDELLGNIYSKLQNGLSIDLPQLSVILSRLELKGAIHKNEAMQWQIARV